MDKVKDLGQVFTEDSEIELMISMIKNGKNILEPSCGTGNFSNKIKGCVSIEFDKSICPPNAINMDFFDYSLNNKHDTIIGNPPYVAYKNIVASTNQKIQQIFFKEGQKAYKYDKRTNLHVFFIDKCIKHLQKNGELIFLTPREFIKQTSSRSLINIMHKLGTMTHFYDYGDKMLFKGFAPNCAIWRFEKDNFSHTTKLIDGSTARQQNINGQFVFSNNIYDYDFSTLFDVKVGGVSGLDNIFVHPNGNKDFVFSKTAQTGNTRRMYYNHKDSYIESHEEILRQRKIKKFDDSNWWHWGRDYYKSTTKRIYVNCKTRNQTPFFTHSCNDYDGSVLALFVKDDKIDTSKCVQILNKLDWSELGFVVGNRFCFSQSALQNIKIPSKEVKKFLTNKK